MPHVSYAETQSRTAKEAGLATLGRNIADTAARGDDLGHLIIDAANRRASEQSNVDRATQFAALVRQIGDAHRQHRDLAPLIHDIRILRQQELGVAVSSPPPLPSE
jgi:cyanophycinase-like exopeptidase